MSDETLFHLALAKPAAERPAFLEEACAGDAALRQRVETLLRSHETPDSFLVRPAENPEPTTDSSASRLADADDPGRTDEESTGRSASARGLGSRIGPYKLLQPIGEGGMGTVYMAEQTQPVRRTVALKLIKAGMDSRQVLARFGAERQALALMDHPNIAKVFDAGTTDTGRPYFVMELVKGIPITRFCDERRLTTRERLELAIPVCQAVHHAHQKGIIHRDLKPSNVLIALYDGKPVPKVIDFGVAKATGPRLTDQTLHTEFGAVVGTLEYMSPEQAELNQLDIDTRSDIYSLGVLIYELLTGSTPLDRKRLKGAAILEMLRVIREEEPPKPSTRLSTTEELPSIAACRNVEPRKLSSLMRGELDWIVMKALEKDRNRRYETANGLAADLRRYLDDEPVQACPPSAWYRFGKFARRNKMSLVMAGVLLLAATVATGALGWTVRDRAARRTNLERQAVLALDDAQEHLDRGAWPQALSSVRRAQGILTGGGATGPAQRIANWNADLELVARLEEVRLVHPPVREKERFDDEDAADAPTLESQQAGNAVANLASDDQEDATSYAAVLREFGLPGTELAIDETARRVAVSRIPHYLLAALDDWAIMVPASRPKLLKIALRADHDPWRQNCREALMRDNRPKLLALAKQPDALEQPPATVVLLGTIIGGFDRPAAIEFLGQAQQRHPGDLWLNYTMSRFLCELRPPRSERAIGFLRAALAIRPDNPIILCKLGTALHHTSQFDEAVATFREAIRLAPEMAKLHTALSGLLLRQGNLEEAVTEAGIATRLNPDNAYAHVCLSYALFDQGKLDEAVAEARTAIRFKPDSAHAHICLSDLLCEQGKLDEALAEAQSAVKLKSDLSGSHISLGKVLRHRGQFKESESQYREAIRLDPFDVWAQISLVNLFLGQRKFDESMVILQKRLEQDPKDYKALSARAECHHGMGLMAKARADMGLAIALAPSDPDLLNTLAWWLSNDPELADRDPKRAVLVATRALELSAKPSYWNTLGAARYRNGDWKEAIDALTKSMDLNKGGDGIDWFFLAMAHWQLGDKLQARSWYDKAIPWMENNQPKDEELIRFRTEAAALLGVKDKKD
jgi:serine/threonine protein kinase/Flp pilus assembly protein TadD